MSTHPNPATLTGQSVATWKFKCLKAGTFNLIYDATDGTGTYLATKDGFNIPANLVNGQVTCVAATASVDGWIKLQGRQPTNLLPAAWQGADVTLTCLALACGCDGFGPYTMTTDASGHYQHLKTAAPGSGVVLGTYSATAARRAYLGAAKTANVVVVSGSNTINTLATALGGRWAVTSPTACRGDHHRRPVGHRRCVWYDGDAGHGERRERRRVCQHLRPGAGRRQPRQDVPAALVIQLAGGVTFGDGAVPHDSAIPWSLGDDGKGSPCSMQVGADQCWKAFTR